MEKQPIVLERNANMDFTAGQELLDPFPLIVSMGIAARLSAPCERTAYVSRDNLQGLLLFEDKAACYGHLIALAR